VGVTPLPLVESLLSKYCQWEKFSSDVKGVDVVIRWKRNCRKRLGFPGQREDGFKLVEVFHQKNTGAFRKPVKNWVWGEGSPEYESAFKRVVEKRSIPSGFRGEKHWRVTGGVFPWGGPLLSSCLVAREKKVGRFL